MLGAQASAPPITSTKELCTSCVGGDSVVQSGCRGEWSCYVGPKQAHTSSPYLPLQSSHSRTCAPCFHTKRHSCTQNAISMVRAVIVFTDAAKLCACQHWSTFHQGLHMQWVQLPSTRRIRLLYTGLHLLLSESVYLIMMLIRWEPYLG
jgi:hypothetical protein